MNRPLAQIVNPVLKDLLQGGGDTGGAAIGSLIGGFIGAFLIFTFIITFLFLMLGGFSWITAGGDKSKLQEARDKITNALIGLIIVAAAWSVMTLVGQFLGINFPHLEIPTVEGL
jgi:hypothetical protein